MKPAEDFQVLPSGEQRVEGNLLWYNAERSTGVAGRAVQLLAQKFDVPLIQPHPPGDGSYQCGLAGPIRSQQQEQLSPFDGNLRAVEGLRRAESLRGLGDSQNDRHEICSTLHERILASSKVKD